MSVRIIYKNLFEIKILHHYFLDNGDTTWDAMNQEDKDKMLAKFDIRDILEIMPTADCVDLLTSRQCICKITSSGILLGIKSEPDAIEPEKFNPFHSLDEDLTFRFLIRLKDSGFSNYSALPLNVSTGQLFIFKNYKVNNSAKYPSLTAIPPVYKVNTEYLPGDMLSDHATNQTKLFTALLKTKNNTSTVTDWLTETGSITSPVNYANINDSYPVTNGILNYKMKTKGVYPVVTLTNLSGDIVKPALEIFQGDFYNFQLDLRGFPQGFYSLHVGGDDPGYGDDVTFYLLEQSVIPFGLIEIRVKSNLAGFDLLDNGHLLSPVYELRFRNRRTHWRYFGKLFSTPYDLPDALPLTRYGHIEIVKPAKPEDTKIIMLPNPQDPAIKPDALVKTDEKKYYSEIHIN